MLRKTLLLGIILSGPLFAAAEKRPAESLAPAGCEAAAKKAKGRVFAALSIDELKIKLDESARRGGEVDDDDIEARNFSSYPLTTLSPAIEKDLSKVQFDTENMDMESGYGTQVGASLVGFHTLENGLSFLGVTAGGDWESPLFFILYWDGKALRGYIPTEGNPWNTSQKAAYGNNEESDDGKEDDLSNMRKRYPAAKDLRDEDIYSAITMDFDKIRADILERLVPKK